VAGRAAAEGRPPRPFVGWLQLLGLLADLVEGKDLDAPAAGLGGQLDP
jgi:hypothetical protein